MATFFIAEILQEDYEAFRQVLKQTLPATFETWSYQHADRVAQRTNKGHVVYEVKVKPDEYSRFLQATQSVPDLQSLDKFASNKADGRRY